MAKDFLVLKNVHKYFSGVHALNDVSISIKEGEIHCLAGENGSGKSTMIKVISGIYQPEEGEVHIAGARRDPLSPMAAIDLGVQVIYQDFSLFGNLTVAENLALNTNLHQRKKLVNWKQVKQTARAAMDQLKIDIDLDVEVDTLSVAEKQLIAIARALVCNARLIIMDEPTTALTSKEVQVLFKIVRQIQAKGIAVLFVSHKMKEMLEISERVTVIRNGVKVAGGPISDFDEKQLTFHMTGQEIESEHYYFTPDVQETPRLELKNWKTEGLSDIDLTLHRKEVVGITGLLGSGRTKLARSLFGMGEETSGSVTIDGETVDISSIQKAIENGVAYVPEDRLTEGLFLTQSINRNIQAATYDRFKKGLVLDAKKSLGAADRMIDTLSIATPTGENPVNTLSGGNQQRVVIAKWLLTNAKILILNGPTVGVDVGSKAEIHTKARELAQTEDMAVLMISDDILELVQNCNRILVMHRGRFVHEIHAEEACEDKINALLKELV